MFAIMLTHKRIVDISWLCLKYRARGTILAHLSGIMDQPLHSRWTVKYIQNAYMYGVPTGLTVGYHKHMIIYWTVKETSYEYKISTWPFTYRMLWKPFKLHYIPQSLSLSEPCCQMMKVSSTYRSHSLGFDVKSLFTNVPTDEAILVTKSILEHDSTLPERTSLTPDQIIDLLSTCVKSTYFQWRETYYQQSFGTPMGSPISPILANIFMEDFEQKALETARYQPKLWLRYVDDTFIIWQHGSDKLSDFLDHLNQQHPRIQFTMETETSDSLPFLDVLISKRVDGSLGHSVYRKPTHT